METLAYEQVSEQTKSAASLGKGLSQSQSTQHPVSTHALYTSADIVNMKVLFIWVLLDNWLKLEMDLKQAALWICEYRIGHLERLTIKA